MRKNKILNISLLSLSSMLSIAAIAGTILGCTYASSLLFVAIPMAIVVIAKLLKNKIKSKSQFVNKNTF